MKPKLRSLLIPALLLESHHVALAQAQNEPSLPLLRYDLTLFDAPFNTQVGSPWKNPSLAQSLTLSNTLFHGVHAGLQQYLEPRGEGFWFPLLSRVGIIFVDFQLTTIPGFSGWLHEEWHRATMSHRGVDSYNEVMDWPRTESTGGAISVSHESDAELARMKRESNADFVRLQAAGFESQWEQNRLWRRDAFFSRTQTWNVGAMWLNLFGNTGYLNSCASGSTDSTVDDINRSNGRNISRRDFTGPDCTGWTYDLHRPQEPYAARGIHPSGVGINRYRKKSDLSSKEASFLKLQANLAYLNYVDPILLGLTEFEAGDGLTGRPFRWNAHLQHTLTSFGGDTALGFFYSDADWDVATLAHVYKNENSLFPGLDVEIFNQKLISPGTDWTLSPRFSAWLQPEELRFATGKGEFGGLLGLRTGYRAIPAFEPYLDISLKSDGWVAGVVSQEKSWNLRLGVSGLQ